MGRAAAVLVLCGLGIAGCRRDVRESVSGLPQTGTVAGVVARVGNQPILASELEARMSADGIGAEEALQALVNEELLVQEATRKGYTTDQADERAIERLMVRAMLHDIEREITPESIPEGEVRQDFTEHADKLRSPEVQDLDEEIRERLAQKKRFERVTSIVERLQAQGLVTYNDPAVKRVLSMAGLPQRAE